MKRNNNNKDGMNARNKRSQLKKTETEICRKQQTKTQQLIHMEQVAATGLQSQRNNRRESHNDTCTVGKNAKQQ